MSFLTSIKEKVSPQKSSSNESRTYQEELRNLDNLIEDLFQIDKQVNGKKKESEEK